MTFDSHAHVIGDAREYPFAAGRSYTPAPASLDAYLAMLDRHGVDRGVLVQPSVYGFDNRCLLDALDAARGRLFGVVVPSPETTEEELVAMHHRGVRGLRCNRLNPGGLTPAAILQWRSVLQSLGWHVALHVPLARLSDTLAAFSDSDLPLVVDHMGRPEPGATSPVLPRLRELVEDVRTGRYFVKVSAPYRLSAETAPWADTRALARALVAANPRQCLWATDWPHVDTHAAVDTDAVVAALDDWSPDPSTRQIVTSVAASRLFLSSAS